MSMMSINRTRLFAALAIAACALPAQADRGGAKAFATTVPALTGAPPEGFTIGKGSTAYTGSVDGSIYKVDLRSGEGEILVPAEPDFDIFTQCFKLGMRVDPRSNYLFVAGCVNGNAYVFDGDSGEALHNYDLAGFGQVINDLAITRDAVYFTNFTAPFLHRLPLTKNGRLPRHEDVLPIPLSGDFLDDDQGKDAEGNDVTDYKGNGIVATPDSSTLIVGNSNNARIYRVDPLTGHSDQIIVTPPLQGFIDGIVLHQKKLFIMTPYNPADPDDIDRIQVVELDKDMLTGTLVGSITDPENLDGVASGAMFGGALYVNNARYRTFPGPDTEYRITRLSTKELKSE